MKGNNLRRNRSNSNRPLRSKTVALNVQNIAVAKIKPARYNPRKDLLPDDPAYKKLAKSLDAFGLVEPLVWNRHNGVLIGGHQRLKVLIERGMQTVPVSVVDIANQRDEKALNVALNKQGGEWDEDLLAGMLAELKDSGIDMDIVGFDYDELAAFNPDPSEEGSPASLADRFGIPPFSVLSAREGWWQDRKRAWIALGIQSELGRGEGTAPGGSPPNASDESKGAQKRKPACSW